MYFYEIMLTNYYKLRKKFLGLDTNINSEIYYLSYISTCIFLHKNYILINNNSDRAIVNCK